MNAAASKIFTIDDLKARLSTKGYKLTPQRQEILRVFLENPERHHLNAEDVHEILHDADSKIGLATVYRGLELLGSLGILLPIEFGDGSTRYELNLEPSKHRHHHLICLKCKQVIEIDEDRLDELEADIALKSGFWIVNHDVKFFGYCKNCQHIEHGEAK